MLDVSNFRNSFRRQLFFGRCRVSAANQRHHPKLRHLAMEGWTNWNGVGGDQSIAGVYSWNIFPLCAVRFFAKEVFSHSNLPKVGCRMKVGISKVFSDVLPSPRVAPQIWRVG